MSVVSENIIRLEELERKLEAGSVLWRVDDKDVRAWNIFRTEDQTIAIARSYIPAGTTFPKHVHDVEREILVCYGGKGTCTLINKGAAEVLKKLDYGAVIEINPGEVHQITAFTDLELIAITLPAAAGFPE